MKITRLYHHTSAERVAIIMRHGFFNNATTIKVMPTASLFYSPRVWFGAMAVIDHELFDDVYRINSGEQYVYIAVDVPLPVRGIKSSACAQDAAEIVNADGSTDGILPCHISSWPCTQYWGPASIWNRFPRTRIELDDVIKLRLAADPVLILKLKERLKQKEPYSYSSFHARVAKILIEHFHVKTKDFREQLAAYEQDCEADRSFVERIAASEAEIEA